MAIQGKTARECFDTFSAYMSVLVTKTLPIAAGLRFLANRANPEVAELCFMAGQMQSVPLDTRLGTIHFVLGQRLKAETVGKKRFRLRTTSYAYRLQAEETGDALIRWEFNKPKPTEKFCRHHVQLRVQLPGFPQGNLDLNHAHVATNYVVLEDVIRFLIVDLGVEPPCGDEWPKVLRSSVKKFEEFAQE